MEQKLIYASRAVRPMTEDDLIGLLKVARDQNDKLGLTGLLLYSGQSFMQMLEGDADTVNALYEKIAKDPRHVQLRLLARSPIHDRTFPDWSMGFEHMDEEELAANLPGFRPATQYPLVNADLIQNGTVAETLLRLYRRN